MDAVHSLLGNNLMVKDDIKCDSTDLPYYHYHDVYEIYLLLSGRRYMIIDGVYRDSIVYVNNFFVGRHQSGYTPFEYDISDFLNYGGDNVIVVYADARKAEGWFYEGGGIYRNVWLYKTAPVHVNDVFVKAVPNIKNDAHTEGTCAALDITVELSWCEYVMPDGEKIAFEMNNSRQSSSSPFMSV